MIFYRVGRVVAQFYLVVVVTLLPTVHREIHEGDAERRGLLPRLLVHGGGWQLMEPAWLWSRLLQPGQVPPNVGFGGGPLIGFGTVADGCRRGRLSISLSNLPHASPLSLPPVGRN